MAWEGVITNAGQQFIESCIAASAPITINTVKTGSGYVASANMRSATALQNEVTTGEIVEKAVITDSQDNNAIQIKMAIHSYTSSYTVKEVGLFATASPGGVSTTVMIALFQNTDGVVIPTTSEFPDFNLILAALLDIDNTANLTITISQSSSVSIYQGTSNAGKFMIVNSEGYIEPTTVPFADGEDF